MRMCVWFPSLGERLLFREDVIITECGEQFWELDEPIPVRYKELQLVYELYPMIISARKHFGDRVERDRLVCLGGNKETVCVSPFFTKDNFIGHLGRICMEDLKVEDLFNAPKPLLDEMLMQMAAEEGVSDCSFRDALSGTYQGRLRNFELEMATQAPVPEDASVCFDLDHNVDARPRIGVGKLFTMIGHGMVWNTKLARPAHALEHLEFNCVPVWHDDAEVVQAPMAHLFHGDQIAPANWKRMGGNALHLQSWGSFLCFALANITRRSQLGFNGLPIMIVDSQDDEDSTPDCGFPGSTNVDPQEADEQSAGPLLPETSPLLGQALWDKPALGTCPRDKPALGTGPRGCQSDYDMTPEGDLAAGMPSDEVRRHEQDWASIEEGRPAGNRASGSGSKRPWLEMGASQDAAEMGSMGLGFGPEGSLGSLPFFDNEQPRQPRDTVRGDLPPVPAFGRCASSASFEEALGQPDQEVRFPDTLAEEDSLMDELEPESQPEASGDSASLELEPES
jgi:hypothetical protein